MARRRISNGVKAQAMKEFYSPTNTLSKSQIAAKYGLDASNFNKYLKNTEAILQSKASKQTLHQGRKPIFADHEATIYDWIIASREKELSTLYDCFIRKLQLFPRVVLSLRPVFLLGQRFMP
jgi:transposase-like protein